LSPAPNPIESASNPNFVLHPGLEDENQEFTRRGHAILDHKLETNPRMRGLNDDPFENGYNAAEMSAEMSRGIPVDTDARTLRDFLVRCLFRAEIMNIQLNNVLGLVNQPQTNAGKRHTWVDLLSRYDHVANSMNAREAEIPELNHGPDSNNNQEILQGPQWFHHGVPVSAHAEDGTGPEPETPAETVCTKDHCACPGPAYCRWETSEPEAEVAGNQNEANVSPSSVIDSDDNDAFIPWSRGPDPRGRNGDSSDDDYKPDMVTMVTGNKNGNDQNSTNQEVLDDMDVQAVGQVFNNYFHTIGMNGKTISYSNVSSIRQNPAAETSFDLSALEEPPTEAEVDSNPFESRLNFDTSDYPDLETPIRFEEPK
jgi:hypothetical protein